MPDATYPPAPMYQPTEILHADGPVVACDGGEGVLGHPRVYLRIEDAQILCPYCSRLYVLSPGARHDGGH